jgi:predicted ABC-type ATPase
VHHDHGRRFAREFLPKEAGCPVFVNADLIAAGLAPFQPTTAAIKAGRLMIEAWVLYDNSGETPFLMDAGGK